MSNHHKRSADQAAASASERAHQFRDQLQTLSKAAVDFCTRLRGIATDGATLGHALAAMSSDELARVCGSTVVAFAMALDAAARAVEPMLGGQVARMHRFDFELLRVAAGDTAAVLAACGELEAKRQAVFARHLILSMQALQKAAASAIKLFSNLDLPRWDATVAAAERARPDLLLAHAGELGVRAAGAGNKKPKRMVVLLRAGQLVWFKPAHKSAASGEAEPPAQVDLALATVKEDADHAEAFSLWTPDNRAPVVFVADSPAERELWLANIRQHIADALADQQLDTAADASVDDHHHHHEHGSVRESPRRSAHDDGADSQDSESSTSTATTTTSSSAAAATAPLTSSANAQTRRHDNETIQRLTELLYCADGNERCVDCGSQRPVWASLNLGVLMCIECCGVHRQLGSHISKVRSLALDRWDVESIVYLTHVGNALANRVRRPAPTPLRPLTATATREERSAHIRAKYGAAGAPATPEQLEQLCRLVWASRPKRDMVELLRLLALGVDVNGACPGTSLLAGARPLQIAAAVNSTIYVELLLNWGAVIDDAAIEGAASRHFKLSAALLWRRAGTDAARLTRPPLLRGSEPPLLLALGGGDSLSYQTALAADAALASACFAGIGDAALTQHLAFVEPCVRRALRLIGALELAVDAANVPPAPDAGPVETELRVLLRSLQTAAADQQSLALGDALELATCVFQLTDFSHRVAGK